MFKYHSDMGHCFSLKHFFLIGKNRHGIGKKGGYFDWELGRNSAPREGQKIPRTVNFQSMGEEFSL